jgi:hypothetical protein
MLYLTFGKDKSNQWRGSWVDSSYGLRYSCHSHSLLKVVFGLLHKSPKVKENLRILRTRDVLESLEKTL